MLKPTVNPGGVDLVAVPYKKGWDEKAREKLLTKLFKVLEPLEDIAVDDKLSQRRDLEEL